MEQQIKELYKKQIELILKNLNIHRKSGCVNESKKFMNLSKDPVYEIKQFYIKLRRLCMLFSLPFFSLQRKSVTSCSLRINCLLISKASCSSSAFFSC